MARHPHRAHHEGGDVIAHALLFRACGLELGRPACGALCRSAVDGMAALTLAMVLRLGLVVPDIVPALILFLAAVAVLRGGGGAPWSAWRLLLWRMALLAGRLLAGRLLVCRLLTCRCPRA